MRPRPIRLALTAWFALALLACDGPRAEVTVSPEPAPISVEPVEPDAARMRAHVEFLAADAQEGRPPGTDADGRVQAYLVEQMEALGLEPAFVDGFVQPFDVTDGVRPRDGATVALSADGKAVEHAVVPFTTDGTAQAPAVYVGYGIAPAGKGTGDYKKIASRVNGKIVIVRDGGPDDDPHLPPAALRPQSKLIAARDHGAVGFVLWDPAGQGGYPNHGRADDLGLPAVFVGKGGTEVLLAALRGKTVDDLKPGTDTRKKKLSIATPVERVKLTTANVAGRLPGEGGDGIMVVGAHMDHLGWGTSSSLAPGERAIHNGADDNASGVAAVLELARTIAARPAADRPHDVLFVLFGAEEMGLLGSKHFVKSLDPGVRDRVVAMLNFDMVGRMSEDGVMVSGAGTAREWPELLEAQREGVKVRTTEDGYGPSDHGSFYEVKIPVLHFFTGPHEDYHKPTDDIDRIDFDGAVTVTSYAARIVGKILDEGMRPAYVEVARPTPRSGGFRVSLGTIPDYAAEVDGVALSGVRKGGAADRAGLRKGDVIKKLGEREVHNLDDYMAAFATMKPGKEYAVTIERGGKALDLKITPDAPKHR